MKRDVLVEVAKFGREVLLTTVVLILVFAVAAVCCGAGLEDAIGATCKVSDSGSVGTGFLYETGPATTGGEELAWIATAAHVVENGNVTVQFGRAVPLRVRVLWRNPRVDGGVLVVPYRALPVPRPRPIRLAPPNVRVQVGQQLWSIGFPNGGEKMAWTGKSLGYSGGTLLFSPGPELGRSGSAILAQFGDELRAVGILSARDSRNLTGQTIGRAVGTSMLLGETSQLFDNVEWFCQSQCPGGTCPPPAITVDPYRLSPYRQYQDQINRGQNERIGGLERSQGTMPLPEVPQVSNDTILKRIVALEYEADLAKRERVELTRRADAVKDAAAELAAKYEPQLKGIKADVNAAIEASNAAGQAANTAAQVADGAKKEASGIKGEVEAVKEEAKGLRGKVEEILQGGGPVKQFIQGKLEEKGMSPTVAALFSGLGVGLIAVLVIVFLRKEGAKAAAGENTIAQTVAALTPTQLDDRIAGVVALGQAALHEKVADLGGTVKGLAGIVGGKFGGGNPTNPQ